jgi:hypothetical protein
MILQEIHCDVQASSLGDGLLQIVTDPLREDQRVKDELVFQVNHPYGWHVMPSEDTPYPQELGEVFCSTELTVSRVGFVGRRRDDA